MQALTPGRMGGVVVSSRRGPGGSVPPGTRKPLRRASHVWTTAPDRNTPGKRKGPALARRTFEFLGPPQPSSRSKANLVPSILLHAAAPAHRPGRPACHATHPALSRTDAPTVAAGHACRFAAPFRRLVHVAPLACSELLASNNHGAQRRRVVAGRGVRLRPGTRPRGAERSGAEVSVCATGACPRGRRPRGGRPATAGLVKSAITRRTRFRAANEGFAAATRCDRLGVVNEGHSTVSARG